MEQNFRGRWFNTRYQTIRENLKNLGNEMQFKTIYPDLKFCGDNAAMIAWAGIKRYRKNFGD